MKELSKEELKDYASSGYLTVGEMKKFLAQHDYPDDAIVVVERVKDEEVEWPCYIKRIDNENIEYRPVWCGVHYRDEKDILFLDLHY